ncbi:hypothetical protein BH18ACT16_BH18ACT16_05500 [soil metagenome]
MLQRPYSRGRGDRTGIAEELAPACATAEKGFHSANVRSTVGRFALSTKVLATKVNGKITMNDALFTTSGLGTSMPTYAITQENA